MFLQDTNELSSELFSWIAPALAHQVRTAGDIGATLHIEPNDNPRAGEPSVVWFALVRQGGETIPLSACDCQLAVYPRTQATDAAPLLEPSLKPITAEGYQGIPATEFTFPQVGAYELVLQGRPIVEGAFQPFELRFDVTVAAGTTAKPSPAPVAPSETINSTAQPTQPTQPAPAPTAESVSAWQLWVLGAIALLLAGGFGLLLRQSRFNRKL